MKDGLAPHLPISPPLSAHDPFEQAFAQSTAKQQYLAPSVAFQSEQYFTACSSPNNFGDYSIPEDRQEDESQLPTVNSEVTTLSPEDFRLSIFRAYSSTIADESMDAEDFDRFPVSPKTTPGVTTELPEVYDEDEMPTVSGWLDDSSDEEEDEEDMDMVVDKALHRKWHVLEHDGDDTSFDCGSVDDDCKCATMVTTTKPRLVTISNSTSTFSMTSHVGMALPVRPSTPTQYREISAFSPDTPHRRPESDSISMISTQEASWGPVREFWSRASSIETSNMPPLPPMYDMNAELPIKSSRRASLQSRNSTSSSKSIISAASLAKARQILPPPILSARPSEWRPSISTINQENSVADLYHAVKAFPLDSLSLSLSVITTFHSVNEASLLTPLKRIFPNASISLLDSLAACVVAQCWVRQYCNSTEQQHAPKQRSGTTSRPSLDPSNRSESSTVPQKAVTTLGLTSKSVTSLPTTLSSAVSTPNSSTSVHDQSASLLLKLDGIVNRMLETATGMDAGETGAKTVVETLKTSVQVVVEAVLEREV